MRASFVGHSLAGRVMIAAALAAASAICAAQPSQDSIPQIPAVVPVTLDAKASALLVLDINTPICESNPVCRQTLPAIGALLAKARAAGVPVLYSTTGGPKGPRPIMSAVAPRPDDPVVSARADKFIDTRLEQLLSHRRARTLVIVGTAANGAVLYTAFHANARGFTVVVAQDGISSRAPINTAIARYQLLNQPGFANATNKPLSEQKVTLSRGDLITFR